MRYACVVWLIAGCGFSAPAAPAGGDPGGDGSDPPGSGSGSSDAAQCDASDPALRLCVSFGTAPMAQDLAPASHAVAEMAGVAQLTALLPIANSLTGTAGSFSAASRLRFAESADFDVSELTVDLWMSPQSTPGNGAHYWMLDNNSQYYASYDHNNTVRCGIGGTSVNSQDTLASGSWHHVACTYGPADQTLRVYVDGSVSGCARVQTGIPLNGKDGIAIGANYAPAPPNPNPNAPTGNYTENFLGGMEGLHLFARALTPDEICQAAGKTGCNAKCPDGGPGPSDPGGRT